MLGITEILLVVGLHPEKSAYTVTRPEFEFLWDQVPFLCLLLLCPTYISDILIWVFVSIFWAAVLFWEKSEFILWSDSSPYGDWSTNRLDFDHASWGCRFVPKDRHFCAYYFRFTNCLCGFQIFSESGFIVWTPEYGGFQSYFLNVVAISQHRSTHLWSKIMSAASFWFLLTLLGNFQTNQFQRRRLTECGMCTIRRLVANVAELSKPGEWLKGKCSLYYCLMRSYPVTFWSWILQIFMYDYTKTVRMSMPSKDMYTWSSGRGSLMPNELLTWELELFTRLTTCRWHKPWWNPCELEYEFTVIFDKLSVKSLSYLY